MLTDIRHKLLKAGVKNDKIAALLNKSDFG